MSRRFPSLALVFISVCAGSPHVSAQDSDFPQVTNNEREKAASPMAAGDAAAAMVVPKGFRVSVFASEPAVQNPIALAWDKRGRMWVAENYTYSDRSQRFDLSLRDRVLIFEDRDNDGRADSRRVFTDNVQMLTSVEIGRGGVWLMCPPQLLFIPDADEDGVPDGPARVVLDGFTVAQDNYHNFANGLSWGPDGWLYGRCGHSCPGLVGLPGTPAAQRIPVDGGIWRYHPERQIVEALCHGTVNPWGHDWDENGELFFINTVIGHVWHTLPGAHFKESFGESRNPRVYARLDTIADHYHFDTKGRWTDSRNGKANELGGGHAHIGMMIYHGKQWPARYRNRLFTLNMHGRRANVELLKRQGAGYVATHRPDFFLAKDPFFRGLEISTGPDGNVFVLDWSDTGECHEHTGVHRTSGRIFKISYGDQARPAALAKPQCMAAPGPLPELWRKYQAGQTDPDMLRALLRHPDEHLRVWAIRLLTDFWPLDTVTGAPPAREYPDDPKTRAELVRLAKEDESGLVQLVLASTLQRLPVMHRAELARELVRHDVYADDRDLPMMVWFGASAIGDHDPLELVDLARHNTWPEMSRWIARNVASRIEEQPGSVDALVALIGSMDAPLQDAALAGLDDAFDGWRKAPEPRGWRALATGGLLARNREVVRRLSTLFGDGRAMNEIREIVRNGKADIRIRRSALETLIEARPSDLQSLCESLLNTRGLNGTAARGLALFNDPAVGRKLARSYRRFHPDDRPALLETLVSRPVFAMEMLNVVAADGPIKASHITPFHARQIRGHRDAALTRRLTEVWGELRDSPTERRALIEKLRNQLSPDVLANADLHNGRALFNKTCARCHTLFGSGAKVGPDLTGAQRSSLDYLLENVLDPSAVVGRDYRMTIVVTDDGRSLNGLVVSKDRRKLVLQTEVEQVTINMDDIDDIKETSLSSMPDGLFGSLSAEEIRDLIGYAMHPSQVPLRGEE